MTKNNHTDRFGDLLRTWRKVRGTSQLSLALDVGVSARHVGFLELGRSGPSRDLVQRMGEVLQLPLREQNRLLLAAGFAPIFPDIGIEAEPATIVKSAIELILENHEPYPAIVLDRRYDVIYANDSFDRLLSELGLAPVRRNLLRILVAARASIVNWDVVSETLAARIASQVPPLDAPDLPPELQRNTPIRRAVSSSADMVVLVTHFRAEAIELKLFSVLSQLATVFDAALEELRVESFFPADDGTRRTLQRLAVDSSEVGRSIGST